MSQSQSNTISAWKHTLLTQLPSHAFTLQDDTVINTLSFIASGHEGHIYWNANTPLDVALLCLCIKHFSTQPRRIVMPRSHAEIKSILAPIGLDHLVLIHDESKFFSYILANSSDVSSNLHPMGALITDGQIQPSHLPPRYRDLLALPSLATHNLGHSHLCFNDVVFLHQLFNQLLPKKNIHLLVLAMSASQQVIQLLDILALSHPSSIIQTSIVAPHFSNNLWELIDSTPNMTGIETPWNKKEKHYSLPTPPDVVIIDSLNVDLVLTPNFNHLSSMLVSAQAMCILHAYPLPVFRNYSDAFAVAYHHQFLNDLVKITAFTDACARHFSLLNFDLPFDAMPLPNTHANIPHQSKCKAFKLQSVDG